MKERKPTQKYVWTEELKSEFINDYKKLSLKQLSEKYKISMTTVVKYLNVFLPNRKRHNKYEWTEQTMNEFKNDYPKLTIREMAKKYRMGDKTVSRYVLEFGLVGIKQRGPVKKEKPKYKPKKPLKLKKPEPPKKEIRRYPTRVIDMSKYKYVRVDSKTWVLKEK